MHRLALLFLLCAISHLQGFVRRDLAKRATDDEIAQRIQTEGSLSFSTAVQASAKEKRKFVDGSNFSFDLIEMVRFLDLLVSSSSTRTLRKT
jgi:hypothetical protein